MRVADFIVKYINERMGVKDIFFVSGGGVMFLTDALVCNKNISTFSCHHEQATTMAATAYAKYSGGIGCAFVTTGCGGTNALTGVLHAWQDNTPIIVISGQCKRIETLAYKNIPLRQIGVQEADIISIVKPITKYAEMIMNPEDVLYHLEKAHYLATSGRPGPVWLDIPMDISAMNIDENSLRHFLKEELEPIKNACTESELQHVKESFQKSQRPVIVAGQGIRLAGVIEKFTELVEKHHIPIVCSRLGFDVLPTEHSQNIGRIGNKGTRAANFTLQNADLVLVLGSRLSVSSTGQTYEYFAREAEVIVVDIDTFEHKKNTVHIDYEINANLKDFMKQFDLPAELDYREWLTCCENWKKKYPVFSPEYNDTKNGINLYLFVEELSQHLRFDDVVVTDAGSAVYVPAQGIRTTTKTQRYVTSGGQAEMGFTLPGCVGVCVSRGGKKDVLGITGDGSLQMNIQELQTVAFNHFPIKLFVWNNDGYLSIRATQNKFFDGRLIGTDSTSGVSFPDLKKISEAYGIKYFRMTGIDDRDTIFEEILSTDGPVLCEVICEKNQLIQPTVSSRKLPNGKLVSSPIEDMSPFLPRDEFLENMIVKPIDFQK